jgi:hypothetical protein
VITYCAHPLPDAIAHDLIDREVAIARLGHSRQTDDVQWRLAGFYDEARLTLAIDLYTNPRYSTAGLQRLLRQFPTDTWMLDTLSRRTPSSTEKQAAYVAIAASHPDGDKFVHRQNVIHWLTRATDPDLSIAELAALLQTDEPEVLSALATASGPIKRALLEGDEAVRTWATRMLYRYKDSDVPALLQTALQDSAAAVRRLAALRLYSLDAAPLPSRDGLLQMLADSDSNVRIAAIDALIALGDTSVIDALISRLADPNPDVSFKAAYALGRLGDPRALAPLLQMRETDRRTTHSGVKLTQTAARAIRHITKRQA